MNFMSCQQNMLIVDSLSVDVDYPTGINIHRRIYSNKMLIWVWHVECANGLANTCYGLCLNYFMGISGAWAIHFLQTPTQIWMRGVAITQLVLLFLCIFLYRFGSPHPTLHWRKLCQSLTASVELGREPKQGWVRSLFPFPSPFWFLKSTRPFLPFSRAASSLI